MYIFSIFFPQYLLSYSILRAVDACYNAIRLTECPISDTTRASLISLWYFLCKHPEHPDKILLELRDVDETDFNALAKLPHLNGVINETLRLVPPQLTGGGRMTSSEGLWIDDTWIPGGTKVTAPKYVLSRRKWPLGLFTTKISNALTKCF